MLGLMEFTELMICKYCLGHVWRAGGLHAANALQPVPDVDCFWSFHSGQCELTFVK